MLEIEDFVLLGLALSHWCTSLIRDSPPPQDPTVPYSRAMPRALWGPGVAKNSRHVSLKGRTVGIRIGPYRGYLK